MAAADFQAHLMALQHHHGGQAPLFPFQISAAFPLSSTGSSIAEYRAATSVISALPVDSASVSLAAPAPTAPYSGLFVPIPPPTSGAPCSSQQEPPLATTLSTVGSSSVPTDVSSYVEQMKQVKTKATIGVLATLIGYVSLNSLYKSLHPEAFVWCEEDRDEAKWIATSKYWLDRKACRWINICGAAHVRFARPVFGAQLKDHPQQASDQSVGDGEWHDAWTEGKDRAEDWTNDEERVLREVPDYVMEYAPLVHLFSGEQFWPSDVVEHLYHTTPTLNYTPLPPQWQKPNLQNLNGLNEFEHGRHVFLTSKDNVEERPEWLESEKNIPSPPASGEAWEELLGPHSDGREHPHQPGDGDPTEAEWSNAVLGNSANNGDSASSPGRDPTLRERLDGAKGVSEEDSIDPPFKTDLRRYKRDLLANKSTTGGRSKAPAVLIVVDKGHGIVDAFWFFFYSFNLGNVVFNIRFGNHVGDWEHTAVRFHDGIPKAVFFSEHNFGSAYSYAAVEKMGKRPVIYSAVGTHAMYATPGTHPYILPWGLLHDQTDRGPLWDPALNMHAYTYDYLNDTLRSSQLTPKAPTGWFHFHGHWGDKFYPLGDTRQYRFAGQYHYVNGPLGPKFKNLGRTHVCQDRSAPCEIKNSLAGSSRIRRGRGPGKGEEMSAEDAHKFLGEDEHPASAGDL